MRKMQQISEFLKANEAQHITSFIEKPNSEVLKGWASDTGEAMQAEGRNYLGFHGYLPFQ